MTAAFPKAGRGARIWRFADCRFDEASLLLTVARRPVELEPRPLRMLALLLAHAGEIVTKDELLEALWPNRVVSEASLTTCMTRLRQALGEVGHTAIRTVHGYGYRFAAPVTVVESAPPALAGHDVLSLAVGDPVPQRPNWRLAERLGTGGYGDPWKAEQAQSGERRVVKFARDEAGLVALRREVALGRLLREGLGPRDDLVRILDWNLETPPFFVETSFYPDGSLADWWEEQGGAPAIPLATRLCLVAEIADALAAAHGMGVLHKDIKPGNVLIWHDPAGAARIALTDFGSGRALDPARFDALGITRPRTEMTEELSTGGTVLYRAPELLGGGAPTVQADIYALGVLLFQLVAGDLRAPLAPGWEARVGDALLREDIALAANGDLNGRLSEAAELSQRLRGFEVRRRAAEAAAANQAEAARLRAALDRAQARRLPLLGLAGALTLGLAASLYLGMRAWQAAGVARQEAARAEAVTAFVTNDLLSAANPQLAADPDVRVKTLLGSAADSLDRRFDATSLTRASIAAVIGSAYAALGEVPRARALLEAALTTRRAALGEGAPATQDVRLALGTLFENEVDFHALKGMASDILEHGRAAGTLDPATELSARYWQVLAACQLAGAAEGCAPPLRPLLADAQRQLGTASDVTLKIQSKLAFALAAGNDFNEAIPLARVAVTLTEKAHGPNHFLVLDRKFHLAEVLVESGAGEEPVRLLTEIRSASLALSGHETEFSSRAANELGDALGILKQYDAGLRYLQVALDYNVRTHGEGFSESREILNNIASMHAFAGHSALAIEAGEKVLALERAAIGADHEDTIWFENNLADYYHRAGRLAESEATYRDTLVRARRTFTHGEWDPAHFEFHLGQVLGEEGKADEARMLLTDSVAQLSAKLGPQSARALRARAALESLKGK